MPTAPARLLLLAAAITASASVYAQTPPCGTTLTRSVVFHADMVCPPGVDGLIVGDHNVAIDLNGYRILGPGSGTSRGVVSAGFDGTKIVGPGAIRDFFALVRIESGDRHEIREVEALGFGQGIALHNTSGSVLEKSRVGVVELGSHPGFRAESNRIAGNDADSIHLYGCDTSRNEITDNQLHPATQFTAVSVDGGASGNLVSGNRIVTGTVFLAGVRDNTVSGNIIDNRTPSWIHGGVVMTGHASACSGWNPVDATDNLVHGNTIIGAPFGVAMTAGARKNKIMSNKIYDQTVAGVRFLAGADYNEARSNAYRPAPGGVDIVDWGMGNLWP
jgi:hypothetical protein